MARFESTVVRTGARGIEINSVLRNTYILLAMTLLFSALMAGVAMALEVRPLGLIITLVGMFGLLFLTKKFRNSPLGLLCVFAFTGFMGFTLGPIISLYITTLSNGGEVVMTALGGTGVIFVGLSGYVLTTRKDFTFIGGMLIVGLIMAVLAILTMMFLPIPVVSLAISAVMILLMSGFILYDTSRIIHGGETNYITATVSLYLHIYLLFSNLLSILGFAGGDD